MDEKNVFGEIHLYLMQFRLEIHMEWFLDMAEFKLVISLFLVFAWMCFSIITTRMFSTKLHFNFWKLPHVFEMSFDVFGVFGRDPNEPEMDMKSLLMNSNVLHSFFTVASLVDEDTLFVSCRCPFTRGNS